MKVLSAEYVSLWSSDNDTEVGVGELNAQSMMPLGGGGGKVAGGSSPGGHTVCQAPPLPLYSSLPVLEIRKQGPKRVLKATELTWKYLS